MVESIEELRAELARQKEQQELLKLKEELAKIKAENERMASAGAAADADAPAPEEKKKKKKEKKAKKAKTEMTEKTPEPTSAKEAEEARELAALQAELAAVRSETSKLEGGAQERPKKRAEAPSKAPAPPAGASQETQYVRRAYVGGLPYSSTAASVSSYFADSCGPVLDVQLKDFEDSPGKFCGIAFVTFEDEDALGRALQMDGCEHAEDARCRLKVRRDQTANRRPPPPRKEGSLTIYAGNMGWDVTKDDVHAYFADGQGCAVANVRYHTDQETGNFRGFCHVEFDDEASLQKALACAGTKWRGRDLRISHSETAKKRPGDAAAKGGKGGGRGRGRGRGGGGDRKRARTG